MARLTSGNLAFEFRFVEVDRNGWVQYELTFLWEGEPLVNDRLLKRDGLYWLKRRVGAFKASERNKDTFLPVLAEVLRTSEPNYWQPVEPSVVIAFYPEMAFPFLQSAPPTPLSDERRRAKELHDGKLPDDLMNMIIFIDGHNLRNGKPFSGEGLSLMINPTREQLSRFYGRLQGEYKQFKQKYGL